MNRKRKQSYILRKHKVYILYCPYSKRVKGTMIFDNLIVSWSIQYYYNHDISCGQLYMHIVGSFKKAWLEIFSFISPTPLYLLYLLLFSVMQLRFFFFIMFLLLIEKYMVFWSFSFRDPIYALVYKQLCIS